MFLLRRRATATTMLAAAGIEDAAGIDLSGANDRRRRTPSEKQPMVKRARRLSENEKARISIYLQILNIVVAALSATLYTVKEHSAILFEIIRTKGLNDILYLTAAVAVTAVMVTASFSLYAIVILHQTLVSALSPMLLVNASFFTLHPHPPLSPSFRAVRRTLSKSKLSLDATPSLKLASASSHAPSNALQIDPRPLIDFSARSSEAGDTPPPPLPNVLVPAVLSPTQLQLRSLSPAFGASMQQVKERDMEEILKASNRPSMPPSLGAILSKRSDLAPLMFGRPTNADRSMSTVSYPDVYGGSGVSDEDEDDKMMRGAIYESEQETEEQESPANLAHIDTDNDFDDEEDGDDVHFLPRDVQAEDIPFTSSPSHINLVVAPEMIDVLDPESRQASMDMASSGMVMPMPHPAPSSSEEAQFPFAPPPSRVATMAQPIGDAVDSPRDIFSPTPVSFPQPVNGLPFAFPLLREQLQQRLASPPSASISQWSHIVAESDKKDDADEHVVEPTPYPSPPFTPPSSRPPTMYSSMALQMPQRELATEMLATPDPFVIERSPLSALVEEAKAELEAVEGSALAMEAPDSVAAEPDTTEPGFTATEAHSESTYEAATSMEKFEQTQVPPSHTETAPEVSNEIHMPVPARGILRNPLSQITQLQNTPPRTISPVKSIGRGGLFDGSRIAVDDFSADSSIVSAADTERTLVASSAEDSLNEVGTIVEQDADAESERHGHRQRSGATSGADDESTAPRAKMDLKKRKKKTKKAKKGVSFDDIPFVIGSDMEQDDDGTDTVLNDVAPTVPSTTLPLIPVPKTFEIVEEDDDVPTLLPSRSSTEAVQGSPAPSRALSMVSEMMSPRSTADELSDSSAVLAPGQFSSKQVDHYGRWFSRAHRDKALPTIQVLRDQMKACSDVELAGRLRLGSRAAPTKLSKTLVGEDNMKGVSANGSLPPPPVRKASGRRR